MLVLLPLLMFLKEGFIEPHRANGQQGQAHGGAAPAGERRHKLQGRAGEAAQWGGAGAG